MAARCNSVCDAHLAGSGVLTNYIWCSPASTNVILLHTPHTAQGWQHACDHQLKLHLCWQGYNKCNCLCRPLSGWLGGTQEIRFVLAGLQQMQLFVQPHSSQKLQGAAQELPEYHRSCARPRNPCQDQKMCKFTKSSHKN